jgi:hypothetical protein
MLALFQKLGYRSSTMENLVYLASRTSSRRVSSLLRINVVRQNVTVRRSTTAAAGGPNTSVPDILFQNN